MKRIVIPFDGTWNNAQSLTNVRHTFDALAGETTPGSPSIERFIPSPDISTSAAAPPQVAWYYSGVGTRAFQWVSGGALGNGLSENVPTGYRDLCREYQPGDQLFLFGFSRGAYTARSLAGLIQKCGILVEPDESLLRQAYAMYRGRAPELHPDAQKPSGFRNAFAYEGCTDVHFLGVWDTVGALGIPTTQAWLPIARGRFQFHDVELSAIVRHAYHAVAIDEHREDYQPTLWMRLPDKGEHEYTVAQEEKPQQHIEQRCFIGAHANVGGGYKNDKLASIPLVWMCSEAKKYGLIFRDFPAVEPASFLAPIPDSYAEFMIGAYRWFKRNRRYARLYGAAINETVDQSVWDCWQAMADYRPRLPKRLWPIPGASDVASSVEVPSMGALN